MVEKPNADAPRADPKPSPPSEVHTPEKELAQALARTREDIEQREAELAAERALIDEREAALRNTQEREFLRQFTRLQSERMQTLGLTTIGVAVALVLGALAGLSASLYQNIGFSYRVALIATVFFSIVAFITLVFSALMPLILRTRRAIRMDEKATQKEAGEAAEALSKELPLFELVKLNRKQMLAYDAIARGQAELAFRNSQIAMALGFLVLLVGAAVAIATTDTTSKITTASLTAIGGALAGFISRTFLQAYRRAIQQMNFYFAQPLITSYLLASERIIGSMAPEKKDQARATVIRQITSELLRPPIPDENEDSSHDRVRRRRTGHANRAAPQDHVQDAAPT